MPLFSVTLHAEVEVNATLEQVWHVLTDFESYPRWNPYITQVIGVLAINEKLAVTLDQPGRGLMAFTSQIVVAKPNAELRWMGKLGGLPGLFTGNHRFLLEPDSPMRTRFIQHEVYTGLLVPFMRQMLERDTLGGFHAMNRALKAEAERRYR